MITQRTGLWLVDAINQFYPILSRHLDNIAAPPGISDEQRAAVLETEAYRTAKARLENLRKAMFAAAIELGMEEQ